MGKVGCNEAGLWNDGWKRWKTLFEDSDDDGDVCVVRRVFVLGWDGLGWAGWAGRVTMDMDSC